MQKNIKEIVPTAKLKEREKEIKITDILLNSLPLEDKFILELKYKERDKWDIITRKFNKEYHINTTIT